MTRFTVNGQPIHYKMDPATPLLWALRDASNLTGTKYGCGAGLCGACTVHVDGQAMRSCQVPIGAHATIDGENLKLEGMVGSLDGGVVYRDLLEGTPLEAAQLGIRLAEILIEKGAGELLAAVRMETDTATGAVI